jgi:hypothetical protein
MRPSSYLVAIALFLFPGPIVAHEGHEHDKSESPGAKFPRGIVLPAMEGPKPWSDKPLLNDPDRFQIAVMTDNTGGHRAGIWMKAVERLNALRPTFVMSVGDLIEGYSTDPEVVEKQWQEFLGFIDRMAMKFFFVPGNHDVTNPVMHDIWRKHFGAEWYSFDYKGVHFVALSSEDTSNQIGEKQLAWLEDDLKKHADARWTMLFLHKPLWTTSERALAAGNPDRTNWKKVEAALGSRPHTVFAGHVHHYVQYDRNGMKYYHLATTGGASPLRGIPYGEFDHVAWVTMEPEGPTVVNLLLDGIVPSDAITEKSIARFRDFLAKTRLEIVPILVDDSAGISFGRIDLRLTNDFDTPIEVNAEIDGLPLRGLSVEPSSALKLSAEPGETKTLSVDVRFGEKIAFSQFAQTLLTAKIRTLDKEAPLSAEQTVPVVIDQKFLCPETASAIAVDGDPQEWSELPLATAVKPLILGPDENWQGPDDASLRFATAHDDRFVYVAADVTDEAVLAADKLELRLDTRWISTRKASSLLRSGNYTLTIPAPSETGSGVAKISLTGTPAIAPADVATKRTKTGWTVEVAMPIELLTSNQSEAWHSFQMTPVVVDVDNADEKPVRLVWRGTKDVDTRNTNYGHFVRAK